ncbi:hypothetical protein P4O66_012487 [Electrophorus voltai]|uniref:SAM-dependent MTase RsmB/NOP-type domain-containing protein n=1 Tax=Electrophorus voltai TaxID=2609070 RepID=A0AAD8Z6Q1_9TELE|nr:hypothetical protein P4O66_012487 [Electrophorus voltai]
MYSDNACALQEPLCVPPELTGMTSPNAPDPRTYPRESPSPEGRTPSSPKSPRTPPPPRKEPTRRARFPDRVYAHAAAVFAAARAGKPRALRAIRYGRFALSSAGGTSVPADGSDAERNELRAYQLAFSALKYQELLEGILIDSCFNSCQQMPDDLTALVVVMLYDFQDRKFQSWEPIPEDGEDLFKEVRRVEGSLFSVDEVCETLKAQGFIQGNPHTHLEGSMFSKDTHCPDILRFPQQVPGLLNRTTLLMDHKIIIQNKSRCLAACAVRRLLVKDADILMVGFFSAHTVAHVAVQASVCSAHIYLCGYPDDPTQREELQSTLSTIGCKNVHLLPAGFGELNEWDSHLQKVRVALLLPRCTASALCDPITHILQEDGDMDLLCDLSRGYVSDAKLQSLVTRQKRDLSHVLTFPKVHAVVYCTCSVYAEENEELVKSTLEKAAVRPKIQPFRIVSTGWTEETEEKFFQLQESDTTDGCFLCVLKREDPVEPESVQDILARAAAKGLLGGLITAKPAERTKPRERGRERERERKKKRYRRKTDSLPPTSSPLPEAGGDIVRFPTATNGPIAASVTSGLPSVSRDLALNLTSQDPEDAGLCPSASTVLDQTSTVLCQDGGVLNGASDKVSWQPKGNRIQSRTQRHTRRMRTQSETHPHAAPVTQGLRPVLRKQAKYAPFRTGLVAHRSQEVEKELQDLPGGKRDEQEALGPGTQVPELASVLEVKYRAQQCGQATAQEAHGALPSISTPNSSVLSSDSSPHLSAPSASATPVPSSGSSES